MSEARSCGRCGADETVRNPVRMSLVNVEKEARQDGYLSYAGSTYEHGYRCVDRDACRTRARMARNPE